jgi:signal transduction histidine kinase
VVTELVHNAIRHARRRVLVHLEQSGAEARLTVEDDGKGVAMDLREHLFERRLPPRGRTGLGLGLSIVSEIVRAHSGRVTSDDATFPGFDPGTVGARFVVSLAAEA